MDAAALSPEQWLCAVRNHWNVDNACHNTWDKIFREDDQPWIVSGRHAPRGAVVVLLLRRIAYNLLALFRAVTQRSDERRQMPCKDLMRWLYNTLVAAQPDDVAGLRTRLIEADRVA